VKKELMSSNDPILFDHDAHIEEQEEKASGAQVIDFTAHRLGTIRRALSHEVIYADNDDLDDEFDFVMFAASGRRGR
jgi:hypothetical protein